MAVQKSSGGINWRWLLSLIAFCAVVLIAAAIIIVKLVPSIAGAFNTIAEILGYIVVAFTSFYFAWTAHRGKKRIIFTIIWAVAVALIIIFLILRAF